MKLNKLKIDIAMANARMSAYALCEAAGIQYATYRRIIKGGSCKPVTVGKIAAALDVEVEELIEKGD